MIKRFKTPLTVLSLMALAALLRVWGLDAQSFSMDEAGVMRDLSATYATLLELPDSFPPLYVMLLKWWNGIFPGDVGARWLSVVFGVISVAAMWGAGKELGDERTGTVAAFLLAVSAFHVFYSQAVRPYSMYFALATAALFFFLRAARQDDLWAWLGFALFSILGVFTHYYFVLLVAASFIGLLVARGNDAITLESLSTYMVITVMALVLIPLLQTDLAYQTGIRAPRTLNPLAFGYTYFAMFTGFSVGPSKTDINMVGSATAVRDALPWVAAVLGLLIAPIVVGFRALHWRRMWIVGALIIVPVLIAGLLGYLLGVTYNVRFVNWCLVPVLLWIAAAVTHAKAGWLTRLSVAGLVVVQLVALNNRITQPRYQNEDMRGVSELLIASGERAPVFVTSDYMAKPLRHYLTEPWVVHGLPDEARSNPVVNNAQQAATAVRELVQTSAGASTFWFVYSRPFHGDPEGQLLTALSESTDLVIERELAGARLYRGAFAGRVSMAGQP